jgi:protein-L-isoaspartate(D-aspartate) O-methyltransferase
MDDWRDRAAAMTQRLIEAGNLRSHSWREAFADVPRHVFVPRFFGNDPQQGWVAVGSDDSDYADLVYQAKLLITQLDGDPCAWDRLRQDGVYFGGWPSSSSSSPALMALMLEALDIHDGHWVLEIGTGTGYNAAILCRRLGAANVTSVDVDAALVEQAREHLGSLGYRPRLCTMDAMAAVPPGRYDRIEVTVAVPQVPTVWIEHTQPGGAILVNLTSGLLSDAMFHLHVNEDGTATGRAIDDAVFFMTTRNAHLPQAYELHPSLDTGTGIEVTTSVDFAVVNDYDSGFPTLLSLGMRDVQRFLTDAEDWNWLIGSDRSWVHATAPDRVTCGGPRMLWSHVERLWRLWNELGRPHRDRLGLTVQHDGEHVLWVDAPGNLIRLANRDPLRFIS